MEKIFSVQDRQNAFEFVLSAARENDRFTFFGVSLIDWKPVLASCLACSYG